MANVLLGKIIASIDYINAKTVLFYNPNGWNMYIELRNCFFETILCLCKSTAIKTSRQFENCTTRRQTTTPQKPNLYVSRKHHTKFQSRHQLLGNQKIAKQCQTKKFIINNTYIATYF